MTDLDHSVARNTFERIRSEARQLSLTDMLLLKKAMDKSFNYESLPERLQQIFCDIGMGAASAYSRAVRAVQSHR